MKAQANGRKAIFITGAASGIGLATARRFVAGGWFVGLADIDAKGLTAALAAIGPGNGSIHRFDVRDRGGWRRELAAFAKLTEGRLDVLMNNAGLARAGFLEQQSAEDVDLQIDVNLKGVINGCQAGFDLLAGTHGSQVVNLASVAGVIAPPRLSIYAATKFAVRALSESLDVEFARVGVGVRCIMPWFLDTPLLDGVGLAGNKTAREALRAGGAPIYRVELASEAVWNAVHGKPRLHHMVGAKARSAALMSRLAPALVRKGFRLRAERP